LVAVAVLIGAGCGKEQSPAQPTPAPPSVHTAFSVSGSVIDTALRPLADVRVEVVDGPGTGAVATTGPLGTYNRSGTFSDTLTVQASKDGYATSTTRLPITNDGGRAYLSFALDPSAPSADISGDYTLTVTADSSCMGLPEAARVRTYVLSLVPDIRTN